jgi:hypothetical protein
VLMLHVFNYSVNMEDHRMLNDAGLSTEYNEIETMVELVLTTLYEEAGALPDEADDIDESKITIGIMAVVPPFFFFESQLFSLQAVRHFDFLTVGYQNLVFDICPPPPKALV